MTNHDRQALSALGRLILLQLIALSAPYAGIRPHPPTATPLLGIAPFPGASVSVALSAMIVQPPMTTAGRGLSAMPAPTALVSFGMQKYFDAQLALIWPAVIHGQIAALAIFVRVLNAFGHTGGTERLATAASGQA